MLCMYSLIHALNTLRPRQDGRHFPGEVLKCIFLNENVYISLKISMKFVPQVWINDIPALVQIMPWRWPGNRPLSEPMMVSLLTHICITRPQWVKITPNIYKKANGCLLRLFFTVFSNMYWELFTKVITAPTIALWSRVTRGSHPGNEVCGEQGPYDDSGFAI